MSTLDEETWMSSSFSRTARSRRGAMATPSSWERRPSARVAWRTIRSTAEEPTLSSSLAMTSCSWTERGGGSMRRSTKKRYARSVGTRPAEVWGWVRYPFSSRSLMVLRTVAGDTPSLKRLETVRLPAGSAVST